MAKANLPTPEELRKLMRYDADTGLLYWLARSPEWFSDARQCSSWNSKWAGREAFTAVTSDGYKNGAVLGRHVGAQRVVWAIYYGEWPKGHIDHINGVKADNRISNLRDVSHAENMRNRKVAAPPKSGAVGVYMQPRKKKWVAMIGYNNRAVYLGQFDTKDAAMAARREAEAKFNFGPSHGLA